MNSAQVVIGSLGWAPLYSAPGAPYSPEASAVETASSNAGRLGPWGGLPAQVV